MHFKEQLHRDLTTAIAARTAGNHIVFGYLGMPGIGKTQILAQVADEIGYEVASHFNIGASSPMDVQIKIPDIENGTFVTLASDDFPWEDSVGGKKIILAIDEITNGTSDTIKAIQRLVNERCLGAKRLGENVIVVLMGNRASDKAGSGNLSTAMYNRVCWRNLAWTAKDSDVAINYIIDKYKTEESTSADICALLMGYFGHKPMLEGDFTAARDKIGKEPFIQWCSPRSLESLVCRIAMTGWALPGITDMAGDIGLGRATELNAFRQLLGTLDPYEKIIAKPEDAKMPESVEAKYAVLAMIAARTTKKDFDDAWKYVARFQEVTLRSTFMKMALKAKPEVRQSKTFVDLLKHDREMVATIAGAV